MLNSRSDNLLHRVAGALAASAFTISQGHAMPIDPPPPDPAPQADYFDGQEIVSDRSNDLPTIIPPTPNGTPEIGGPLFFSAAQDPDSPHNTQPARLVIGGASRNRDSVYIGDEVGYASAYVGDVDGDDHDDYAVTFYRRRNDPSAENYDSLQPPTAGALANGNIAQQAGCLQVYSGRTGETIGDPIWGRAANTLMAHSYTGLKDIDGDGCDELLIGLTSSASGSVRVYSYTDKWNTSVPSGHTRRQDWETHLGSPTTEELSRIEGKRWVPILRIIPEINSPTQADPDPWIVDPNDSTNTIRDATSRADSRTGFGFKVGSSGDVNGDGQADIRVRGGDFGVETIYFVPDKAFWTDRYNDFRAAFESARDAADPADPAADHPFTTYLSSVDSTDGWHFEGPATQDGVFDPLDADANEYSILIADLDDTPGSGFSQEFIDGQTRPITSGDLDGDTIDDLVLGDSGHKSNRGRLGVFLSTSKVRRDAVADTTNTAWFRTTRGDIGPSTPGGSDGMKYRIGLGSVPATNEYVAHIDFDDADITIEGGAADERVGSGHSVVGSQPDPDLAGGTVQAVGLLVDNDPGAAKSRAEAHFYNLTEMAADAATSQVSIVATYQSTTPSAYRMAYIPGVTLKTETGANLGGKTERDIARMWPCGDTNDDGFADFLMNVDGNMTVCGLKSTSDGGGNISVTGFTIAQFGADRSGFWLNDADRTDSAKKQNGQWTGIDLINGDADRGKTKYGFDRGSVNWGDIDNDGRTDPMFQSWANPFDVNLEAENYTREAIQYDNGVLTSDLRMLGSPPSLEDGNKIASFTRGGRQFIFLSTPPATFTDFGGAVSLAAPSTQPIAYTIAIRGTDLFPPADKAHATAPGPYAFIDSDFILYSKSGSEYSTVSSDHWSVDRLGVGTTDGEMISDLRILFETTIDTTKDFTIFVKTRQGMLKPLATFDLRYSASGFCAQISANYTADPDETTIHMDVDGDGDIDASDASLILTCAGP